MSRYKLLAPVFQLTPSQKRAMRNARRPKVVGLNPTGFPALRVTKPDQLIVGEQYAQFDSLVCPVRPPFPQGIRDELLALGVLVERDEPVSRVEVQTDVDPEGQSDHVAKVAANIAASRAQGEPTVRGLDPNGGAVDEVNFSDEDEDEPAPGGVFAEIDADGLRAMLEYNNPQDSRRVLEEAGVPGERIEELFAELLVVAEENDADDGSHVLPLPPKATDDTAGDPSPAMQDALDSLQADARTIESDETPVEDSPEPDADPDASDAHVPPAEDEVLSEAPAASADPDAVLDIDPNLSGFLLDEGIAAGRPKPEPKPKPAAKKRTRKPRKKPESVKPTDPVGE